jgi:large subunit ribosomal protein L18
MNHSKQIRLQRKRRAWRVRKHVRGTQDRPRLCIVRSLKHIYAQVVDDTQGSTLAAAATTEKEVKSQVKHGGNKDAAAAVGRTVAKRAIAAGVQNVAFDRGSNKYHGRIAALADAAREAGLKF